MPAPIAVDGSHVDLSSRVLVQAVENRSPSSAAETVLATLTVPADLAVVAGVVLVAFLAIKVGLNGTAVRLRVRQTGLSGALVADTGAVADTAGAQVERVEVGFDAAPGAGSYVLTSETPNATNPSTLGLALLVAVVV